jgi:hypothetical protein
VTDFSAIRIEIVRLHDFFQAWFNGVEGPSLSDFSDALDSRFFMVAPSGTKIHKADVVNGVEIQFGKESAEINIRNVEIEHVDGWAVTATYEEHQIRDGDVSARLSTVSMVKDTDAPGGYRWLFVHETWIQAGTPSSK